MLLAIAAATATTATSTCSTRTADKKHQIPNPKSNLKLFILRLNFRPLSCKAQDHHQKSSSLPFHSFFLCSNRDHRKKTGSNNANRMVILKDFSLIVPCFGLVSYNDPLLKPTKSPRFFVVKKSEVCSNCPLGAAWIGLVQGPNGLALKSSWDPATGDLRYHDS